MGYPQQSSTRPENRGSAALVPFDHILGQSRAVDTLTRALRSGNVHHAYRFEGLAGVGKTMAATAFAQALLCSAGDRLGCGACDACRRAAEVSDVAPRVPLHPDVIYVGCGLYPPELLGGKKENKNTSVEQIRRVVLSRASFSPYEGRARVFIIHDAERLSVSAANALLKILEEPVASTYFVLLSAQADRLLDTIRSRSIPVRFGPLSDDVLAKILRKQGVSDEHIAASVAVAGGSASVAILAADPEKRAEQDAFVQAVLDAIDAPDFAPAIALSEAKNRDRQRLAADLESVAALFARRSRAAVRQDPCAAEQAAHRYQVVIEAIDAVGRNASLNLVLCKLLSSLR